MLNDEPLPPQAGPISGPLIVALVIAESKQRMLDQTLGSLSAEGLSAVTLGQGNIASLAEAADQIAWADEPWFMPMAAGDILAPGAAAAYRNAISTTSAHVIYADDDLLAVDGARTTPHFKPDWNAELFANLDYLTGACLVRATRAELLDASGGADWPQRLVAAAATKEAPLHIPRILHHRSRRPQPRLQPVTVLGRTSLPALSVIIPTRNRLDLLRVCLEGLERTAYNDLEVIIVDNDSDDPATLAYLDGLDPTRVRVLRHPGPFNFSAINNRAVQEARGHLLCLLNNDIEVIEPDWLATLASQALRPDVGAVGARLLYPDGRIQHAGVVVGIGGGAAHAHRFLDPAEEGYFHRHALPQFVSAVTAACLVVQRERFLAVGGLDERRFAVAFNDVDLCLRLNQQGWQSLYEPRATLVHHESVSRGFDRDPEGAARLAGELAALKELWNTGESVDPFHHPELSPFSEQFVLRL